MDFFAKVFTALANLSAKMPQVDVGAYFIAVIVVIAALGLIIGLTYFVSPAYKMRRASRRIVRFLEEEDGVDDDNVGNFTSECFSLKVPHSLRDSWVEYLGVRFGYPSELVSEREVFDREVKKTGNVRANVFIALALVLTGFFAFWGFGALDGNAMGVIHCTGLVLSGIVYLALTIIGRLQYNKARACFYDMQDELDAKVNLQVEKNYSTDSSPLSEISAMVDEIIARNTAKFVDLTEEEDLVSAVSEVDEDQIGIEELIRSEERKEDEKTPARLFAEGADESESVHVQDDDVPEVAPSRSEELTEDSEELTPIEELISGSGSADGAEAPADANAAEPEDLTDNKSEFISEDADNPSAEYDGEDISHESENSESAESEAVATENTYESDADESEDSVAAEETETEAQDDGDRSGPVDLNDEEIAENVDATVSVDKIENEDEDEEMFGRKKKEAQLAAQQAAEQSVDNNDIFAESEIINDDDDFIESELIVEEPMQESVAAEITAETPIEQAPEAEQETVAEADEAQPEQEDTDEAAEDVEQTEEDEEETAAASEEEAEEEVVYVVEGPEEDDELVKPAKLEKLTHLVDYVLAQNFSKAMLIKVTTMLLGAYNIFKNSPEDKAILVKCLTKMMFALQTVK